MSDATAPKPTVAERTVALAVTALALAHGAVALSTWVVPGTFPGARTLLDPWPLSFGVVLLLLAAAAILARAGSLELGLAALAWSLGVEACRDLPAFSSARFAGDGLALVPWHLAIALGGGMYALRPWRGHDARTRACALLVLWTTGNLKLFTRDREATYSLFAAAVLLVWTFHGRRLGLRALLGGPARVAAWIAGLFVLWWVAVTTQADSPRLGADLVLRIGMGAMLAWTLAGALDPDGARRCLCALVVGLLLSLGILASVAMDMSQYASWERIAGWRMRLFGLHANQIGPLFAWGACLLAPLALLRPRGLAPLSLLVPCLGALYWTGSRASWGGLALGLVVALLAATGRLPRRPGRWLALGAVTVVAGLALLLSPAGAPITDGLDARAQESSAIGQRWHFWKMAGHAIADNPVFGLGPNHYYAHTAYAEPSYYDGTIQALHPHNVVLAAGESAGVPGMLLFVALCLAALEAVRRRCQAEPAPEARRWWAGLLGALVALLASNQFDLGQSQNTFVPLLVWISLGLAGAGLAGAARPAPTRGTVVFAALALLAGAVAPLLGRGLADRGRVALFSGDPARASELYTAALRVQPWSEDALRALTTTYREQGRRGELLAALRAETVAAPSRASGWYELARELLEQDRPEDALAKLSRAEVLDPRGPRTGNVAYSKAWAQLLLGDAVAARVHLLDGVRTPGGSWRKLPQRAVARAEGDPPGARTFAFEVAGGGLIRVDDLLAELGAEAVGLADADPVRARRLLVAVVEEFRVLRLPGRALPLVEEFISRRPELFGSMDRNHMWLLADLRRWDELRAVYESSPYRDDAHITATYLKALLDGGQLARIDLDADWMLEIPSGKDKDLFFTAGKNASVFDARARLALLRREVDAAFQALDAGLFDRSSPGERVLTAEGFLHRCGEQGFADDVLARALGVLLHQASLGHRSARDPRRHRSWAVELADHWSGSVEEMRSAAVAAGEGTGQAGESFLAALDQLLSEG